MRSIAVGIVTLLVSHAASLTLAAGRTNLAVGRVHQSALRMQAEIPSKFVKFRVPGADEALPAVSVTLPKPLGLKLVEGSTGGVRINGVVPEGSACQCAQIKAGMTLVSVGGQECSSMTLTSVLGLIDAQWGDVDVVLTAAEVNPSTAGPSSADEVLAAPKREKLEGRDQIDASFDKNFGSEEGFGKLVTKVTKTVFNPTTWKNPLWGGSLAFAVGFPLLIVALAGDRL